MIVFYKSIIISRHNAIKCLDFSIIFSKIIDENDSSYADHCFVERITRDGQHLIYDTTFGFVYDKDIYWAMEHPDVRRVDEK